MVFEAIIQLLQDFGFFRVVLPFLLIFALFYALLNKTGVLGQPNDPWTRSVSTIIALVAAFLVIAYTPVVDALATLIPQASFLLVLIMLLLMIIAFIVPSWGKAIEEPKWWLWIPVFLLVLIFVAMAGYSVGPNIPWLYGLTQFFMGAIPVELTEDAMNMLIGFAVVIAIPLIVIAIIILGGKETPSKFEIVGKK